MNFSSILPATAIKLVIYSSTLLWGQFLAVLFLRWIPCSPFFWNFEIYQSIISPLVITSSRNRPEGLPFRLDEWPSSPPSPTQMSWDPFWPLFISKGGAVVRALASHQCGLGFDSWRQHHMWVEFVVGFLPCSERFFSGYSSFPLSLKAKTSKFQFDLEICTDTFQQALLSAPWVNK